MTPAHARLLRSCPIFAAAFARFDAAVDRANATYTEGERADPSYTAMLIDAMDALNVDIAVAELAQMRATGRKLQ